MFAMTVIEFATEAFIYLADAALILYISDNIAARFRKKQQ